MVRKASGLSVITSTFLNNWKRGVSLQDCLAPQLIDVGVETNNRQTQTGHDSRDSEVSLVSCHGFLVTGCHFENFNRWFAHTGLYVYNCLGGYVGSCSFGNDARAGSLAGRAGSTSTPRVRITPDPAGLWWDRTPGSASTFSLT